MQPVRHLFCTIVALGLLGGCGGESSQANNDSDTDPLPDTGELSASCADSDAAGLTIEGCSPEANADKRALVTDVGIKFSQPLIEATVSTDTFELRKNGTPIEVEVRYHAEERTVRLDPTEPLEPATEYQVIITDAVMGEDGSEFGGSSWSFSTAANVGATSQAIIDICMDDEDIEMLGRINNARESGRFCGEDPAPAVPTLRWNCTIATAAETHSTDMATHNFFSHTGSDGSSVAERLTAAGYEWRSAAENIAAGQRDVAEVMEALLESPDHCRNIMGISYTEMGSARVDNNDTVYRRYWTQNFARPR